VADRYWNPAANANWGDANVWATTDGGDPTGVATPTSSDDVFFTSTNAYNCVVAAAANCKSIDFTGGTGYAGTFSGASQISVYGNFTLHSATTFTYSGVLRFMGQSGGMPAGGWTLTCAGKTFSGAVNIDNTDGTVKLMDTLVTAQSKYLQITTGTFDANDQNITIGFFYSVFSATRVLYMGSGTWTLIENRTPFWQLSGGSFTLYCETSTIKYTATLTAEREFLGAGQTYYNFWNATSGAYGIKISGTNTFNDFKIDAGRTVKFTNSTTQTVTTFTASGTAGNLITLRNSSSTTKATLAKAGGGVIDVDYLDIDYIIGSPEDTWYVGENSVDGGNNTNIYFEAAPSGANIAPIINTLRRRYA